MKEAARARDYKIRADTCKLRPAKNLALAHVKRPAQLTSTLCEGEGGSRGRGEVRVKVTGDVTPPRAMTPENCDGRHRASKTCRHITHSIVIHVVCATFYTVPLFKCHFTCSNSVGLLPMYRICFFFYRSYRCTEIV